MLDESATRPFGSGDFYDLVEKRVAELIKAISTVPPPGGSWHRFSQLLGERAYKECLAQLGPDPRATLSLWSNGLRSFMDENLPKLLLATNGLGSGERAYKECLAQLGFDPATLSLWSNGLRSFMDENLPKLLLATNGLGPREHDFFPQVHLLPTGTNHYSQNLGRTNTDLKLANEPMMNSDPPSVNGPKAGIPIDDDARANRKQLLDRRALNAMAGETFTISEAAIILDVSQSTIRRWRQDGDLARVKKRGRVTALSVKRLKFPEA
jgi:hypothetical protein